MLRSKRFWLGMIISVVFLALAFRGVQLEEAWQALAGANYLYILPALFVYFIGVWLRAWRWRVLLIPVKDISAGALFPTVVIGYMANNILPARLGEVVRAYILGEKEKVSKSATLATIVVERMFDGLSMIGFMIVILWLFPLRAGPGADLLQGILRVGAPLFLVALVVFLVVASSRPLALRLAGVVISFLPEGLRETTGRLVGAFLDGLAALRSPRQVLAVFLLSVVVWLLEAGMYYIIMLGFEFRQSFYVLLLATAAANLFTIAPSTPGYVGVFDFPVRATLTTFGVVESAAISYTLVLHVALWAPVTLLGVFYLWRDGLSLGWLTRRPQQRTGP